MSTIARKHATRRLPQCVKDYVAEGGNVLPSDDEPVYEIKLPLGNGVPSGARPTLSPIQLPGRTRAH